MVDLDKPLELQERTVVRKSLNTLRRDGLVPAVIHNHGQPSVNVMANELLLGQVYREAGKHHPLQLQVGDQNFLALIKDAHFHPAKRRLQHVVFQAIKRDEKVEAEVPIHLEGEIPAEKIGLMIIHQLDHVEVEALPKDLPDELKTDAAKLAELNDKITVADLQIPDGVTVLTDADHPIATVVEPKEQVIEEPEPEVIEGEEAEGAEEAVEGEGETSATTPEVTEREAAGQEAPKE